MAETTRILAANTCRQIFFVITTTVNRGGWGYSDNLCLKYYQLIRLKSNKKQSFPKLWLGPPSNVEYN